MRPTPGAYHASFVTLRAPARAAFDHELALALARISEAEIERRYRRLGAR